MAKNSDTLRILDLGRQSYEPVWAFQKQLHAARHSGEVPDSLIFVEHDPVYTLGKNGEEEHIVGPDQFLQEEGIEVFRIGRGGDVTYHGPGQIVGYPIFDLRQHRKSIRWYMESLEEVILRVLETWDIEGERVEGRPGVWVDGNKICAVGVRIARWVSLHGFAFNLFPNMDHFDGIVPCGIQDAGVTSVRSLLDRKPDPERTRQKLTEAVQEVFSFDAVELVEDATPDTQQQWDVLV